MLVLVVLAIKSDTVFKNLMIFSILFASFVLIHAIIQKDFYVPSAILSFFTYGAIIFLIVVPKGPLASESLYDKMAVVLKWCVVLEGMIGIIQGLGTFLILRSFDASVGDAVAGTIKPSLFPTSSFSNPMFASNMALMLIVLIPYLQKRKMGFIPFIVGGIATIMASVVHTLIFAIVAFLISVLYIFPDSFIYKRTLGLISVVAGMVLVTFLILPQNLSNTAAFARQLFQGESPKATATARALTEIPKEYPLAPLLGLGPGQYSSRAGMIGTGMYFGGMENPRDVSFLPSGMSMAFQRYFLNLWTFAALHGYEMRYGSTHQPYYSWLSLYSEFGVGPILLILVILYFALSTAKKNVIRQGNKMLGFSFSMGLLFLCFLGIQENYWEIPQAIFIGCMVFKVMSGMLFVSPAKDNFSA